MSRFKGNPCPYCEKAFAEDDDLVVCPDCGTPHHRSCYAENNKCCNEQLHGGGFVWKSVIENAVAGYMHAEEAEAAGEARWKAFAETHGRNMDEEKLNSFRKFFDTVEKRRENLDKMKERFEARDIYGVSEHEIVSFQSTGNPFVIERYRRIADRGNPVSFNIFAGVLNPIYSFYFRALPIGVVLAVINFILYVPHTLSFLYSWSLLANQEILEAMQNFYDMYASEITMATFTVVVLSFTFFDYFYLKWMTSKIKHIRAKFEANLKDEESLGNDYYIELSRAGRPRVLKAVVDYSLTWSVLCVLMLFAFGMAGVL